MTALAIRQERWPCDSKPRKLKYLEEHLLIATSFASLANVNVKKIINRLQ